MHVIHFPGAPFIRLTFDKETSTSAGTDFVAVFADEACSEPRGRWSGHSGAWPGRAVYVAVLPSDPAAAL